MNLDFHEMLAGLLEYPGEDFARRLEECRAIADDEKLAAFVDGVQALSRSALEELYIQTFDFSPNCALDLGWQLFAEDYNRGLFLAKLRGESRRLNLPETGELPDHLPHVLRLLARMPQADAGDFAAACGLPAVEKILAALDEQNPYRFLIQRTLALLMELSKHAAGQWADSASERRVSLTQLSTEITETALT